MIRRLSWIAVLLASLAFPAAAATTGMARYRVQFADHVVDTDEAAAQILAMCRCRQEPYGEAGFSGIVVWASPSTAQLLRTDARVAALDELAEVEAPAPRAVTADAVVSSPRVEPNAVSSFNGLGQYTYDGSGNVRKIGSSVYTYDVYGRVVSGDAAGRTQTYTYDRYGNQLSKTTDNVQTTIGVDASTNRLTSATYDAAGRLRNASGVGTYTYDSLDMMTGSTSGPSRRLYVYTASDERLIAYNVDANNTPLSSEWTLRDPSGAVLRRFTRSGSGKWSWDEDYVYRDGQMLAAEVAGPARTLHFHLDHLGTPRLITNAAGGFVSEHAYFAFGEEATSPVSSADRKQFTGHERDTSGLDYMHARYYGVAWGRFLSVDPVLDQQANLQSPQRWNRYIYVSNNPISKTDPDGRDEFNTMHRQLAIQDDWEGHDKGQVEAILIYASLFLPGPEDVPMALLGATKAYRAGGRLIGRLLGAADDLPSAGSIRDINPSRSATNCVNCAATVDNMLATGRPASALPSGPKPITDLGTRWASMGSRANVEAAIGKAGGGAHGIVYVGTGKRGSVGHVFNVVNQKGIVRFLDGQTGKAVQWSNEWTDIRLLRTN
jgi:RHS repeat-associated protein